MGSQRLKSDPVLGSMNATRFLSIAAGALVAVALVPRSGLPAEIRSAESGHLLEASVWGGADPARGPEETYTISAGHHIKAQLKESGVTWPVRTIVVPARAALSVHLFSHADCDGATIVMDGGELNMVRGDLRGMTLDMQGHSTVRIDHGGFANCTIIGSGILELVRESGNSRELTLRDVDFSGYRGRIVAGDRLRGRSSLRLEGTSRTLRHVPIEVHGPLTILAPDGLNMAGSLLLHSGQLGLGNHANTFGHGSRFGRYEIIPGTYDPESTDDYARLPTSSARPVNLQSILQRSSVAGSSITVLDAEKPTNRIDAGTALPVAGDAPGAVLLNGGTLTIAGRQCVSGSLALLNHSTIDLAADSELTFGNVKVTGAGNISFSGAGGRVLFSPDCDLSAFSGAFSTAGLTQATELVFLRDDWGRATLLLDGTAPIQVRGNGPLRSGGRLIVTNPHAIITQDSDFIVVAKGSAVDGKQLIPGAYAARVMATWNERQGNRLVPQTGAVDLAGRLLPNAGVGVTVVDFDRVHSTESGRLDAPESWGGIDPERFSDARYHIASGHVMTPGRKALRARQLAIGKDGVLSLHREDLDRRGTPIVFDRGTLVHAEPAPCILRGDLVIDSPDPFQADASGVVVLDGGDLTIDGNIIGALGRQSVLYVRRDTEGTVTLTIAGDMDRVPAARRGYDLVVDRFHGGLDLHVTHGTLNDGYVSFEPAFGTISSGRGFNSPRATLRMPGNRKVRLDLKGARNVLQIGTTIGGQLVERGEWNAANTAGFTQVPVCNTSTAVDLTPYLINTAGATLAICNPRSHVTGTEQFDTDQFFAPDSAWNQESLDHLRSEAEAWCAPFRIALEKKLPYHTVAGTAFTHKDYTYGQFPQRIDNLYGAYKILGEEQDMLDKLMIMADYFRQLVSLDPGSTSADRKTPSPAEQFTCASWSCLPLCAWEIYKKEYYRPGSMGDAMLAKADAYLAFAWSGVEPHAAPMGLKKYLYGDGILDPTTGVPLALARQDAFTWNSESALWRASVLLAEAIRMRKIVTGKDDWDRIGDIVTKSLVFRMDAFFDHCSLADVDGRPYAWWPYSTNVAQRAGQGPEWRDGLYKGVTLYSTYEDWAHCQGEMNGWAWMWMVRRGGYGLSEERMARLANGVFYWMCNTRFGGLGRLYTPFDYELGEQPPVVPFAHGEASFARFTVCTIPQSFRAIALNHPEKMNHFQPGWLFAKWLYHNRDRVGFYPPRTQPSRHAIKAGTSLAIDLLSGVADPDTPSAELWIVSVTKPAHGRLTAEREGVVSYVPDRDFAGKDAFGYQVTDGVYTIPGEVVVQVQ